MNKTPKRLLTAYYRHKHGGFCKRYYRALLTLCDDGIDIDLVCCQRLNIQHENLHYHTVTLSIPEKKYPIAYWLLSSIKITLKLAQLKSKYHYHAFFSFAPFYSVLHKFTNKKKEKLNSILFLRTDDIIGQKIKERSSVIIYILKKFYKMAFNESHLIGVTQTTLNSCLSHFHSCAPLSTDILYNEIPTAIETYNTTQNSAELNIGIAGVLEHHKGQLFLLEALQNISSKNWKLHVFGDGPEYHTITNSIQSLNLSTKVIMHGWVDSAEIWPKIDLLLAPSSLEGLSNTLLESIANKKPFLCSSIPQNQEVFPASTSIPLTQNLWAEKILYYVHHRNALLNLNIDIQNNVHHLRFNWENQLKLIFKLHVFKT